MSVNSRYTAWALNDGRLGHWRQVRALANCLPVETEPVSVRLRRPWRWFAPYRFPGGLAAHPDWLNRTASSPRLILSAGRRSAAAARWLKDHFNGVPKTVQILDCGLAPRHFDWIIVPEHDRVEGPNVIRTIGSLNPVDSSWIRKSAAAHGGFDCGPEGNAVPCVTLLLGGPGRRFSFSRRWFRSSFRAICSRVEEQGGQVIVVESSRTPGWAAQAMADSRGRCPVRRVPWVVSDPAGSETAYASALDMADALVVSADSVNLLSEACASGKPVFLAGLAQTSGKKSRFCNRLIDEGYALNLEQAGALEQLSNEKIPATRLLRETREVARQLIDSGLLG